MTTGDHSNNGQARADAEVRWHKLDQLLLRRDVEFVDRTADLHARERVERAAGADPRLADEMERTRAVIVRLSEPIESPDFSAQIMRSLHRETPFLDRRGRRRVRAWRVAVACAALVLVTGVVGSYRMWPGWSNNTPGEAPIAAVVDSARADASAGVTNLVSALEGLNRLAPTDRIAVAPAAPSRGSTAAGQALVGGPLTPEPNRINMRTARTYSASPSGGTLASSFGSEDGDAGKSGVRVASSDGSTWRAAPNLFVPREPRTARTRVPFHPERGMAFTSLWDPEEAAVGPVIGPIGTPAKPPTSSGNSGKSGASGTPARPAEPGR